MPEEISVSNSAESQEPSGQGLLFGKTCPESSTTKTTHLDASSLDSLERMLRYAPRSKDGKTRVLSLAPSMAWPGAFSTPNISECPNAAKESLLSDVLETGDVPQKYFLSPKACAGILRRARNRRKEIPEPLRSALTQVAKAGKIVNQKT